MFLLNCWYVALTSDEMLNRPLGRTICNQPICFYRDSDGVVQAVEDFCPHRGLPLSLGSVENDAGGIQSRSLIDRLIELEAE